MSAQFVTLYLHGNLKFTCHSFSKKMLMNFSSIFYFVISTVYIYNITDTLKMDGWIFTRIA